MIKKDFGSKNEPFEIEPGHKINLYCKCIAPGLTLGDLMSVFNEAKSQAPSGSEFDVDFSERPDVRGVKAVTERIIAAFEEKES